MIPSNPRGGSRSGQPSADNQAPSFGFYQASAFGQFSPQGNAFFGQTSTPSTCVSGASQAPTFEQPSSQAVSSVFGQTAAKNTSSVFGMLPSYGVTPTFDSSTSLGPSPPLGFRRTVFGHPSSSVTTSVFSTSSGVAENKSFPSTNFSFKPVSESHFRPIFGAVLDPQSSTPDSAFSMSESQTSSSPINTDSASINFFSLPGAKTRPEHFNFSQPTLGQSASTQSSPLTTGNSSTNTVQFTFSQPLLLSSSSSLTSTSQPTTPSSFSFSIKTQPTAVLKGTTFDQSSLFGDTKAPADTNPEEKEQKLEDNSLFTAFTRGTKRKEGTVVVSAGLEKSATNEGVPPEADSSAHPTKRPFMRPRGPLGGIFGKAVSDLCREGHNPGRYQAPKGTQQQVTVREQVQTQRSSPPAPSAEDLSAGSLEQLQESQESGETSETPSCCYCRIEGKWNLYIDFMLNDSLCFLHMTHYSQL